MKGYNIIVLQKLKMLENAITLVLIFLLTALLAWTKRSYWSSKKKRTSIPGLTPSSKENGNLGDLVRAGSVHDFLMGLHKQFGPIASFWWEKSYTVSIASVELFKEHNNVFDRPADLFHIFWPFLLPKSLQFANGDDARARRHQYGRAMTYDATNRYIGHIQEISDEIAARMSSLVDTKSVPLTQNMGMVALKSVLLALFGFRLSDKLEAEFKGIYDDVWKALDDKITEPPILDQDRRLQEGAEFLKKLARTVIKHRKAQEEYDEELLIDTIIENTDDEDMQVAEVLVYVIGGFHTSRSFLTWAIYYITTNPNVEQKLMEEVKSVLGDDDINHENIGDLLYTRQVLNETLRNAAVGSWAARYTDYDIELGGYKILQKTPIIQAVGVVCKDEQLWPQPDRFDPDRFSKQNMHRRPNLSFSPFGFGGKRICPGLNFAYAETTIAIVTMLRKFKFKLVHGQKKPPLQGFITRPRDEIWVTLSHR